MKISSVKRDGCSLKYICTVTSLIGLSGTLFIMASINLYNKISEIANNNSNLKPMEILKDIEKKENYIKQLDDEIKTLYFQSYSDKSDSEVKMVADNMITNITDGRFKDLIDEEPVPIDPNATYDTTPGGKLETLKTIKCLLENLKLKNITYKSSDELDFHDIKIQMEDTYDTKNNLEKMLVSLNQLKHSMENMVLHPSFNETVKRDEVFENNMKEVCKKVHDFNKYFKAASKIEDICKKATDQKDDPGQRQNNLPQVIAALLKDVESVIIHDNCKSSV